MYLKCSLKNYTNNCFKKFRRRKVYARFKDNIWTADLDEMGSLSSMNQGVQNLLCVLVFNKYAQDKPVKDQKA